MVQHQKRTLLHAPMTKPLPRSPRCIWSSHLAFWTLLALTCLSAQGSAAQADTAIVLTVPFATLHQCAVSGDTIDAASRKLMSRSLDVAAGPFSDQRTIMTTFDTSGHAMSLVDVAVRAKGPVIESAAVQFDTIGRAVAGVRQHLTPSDFTKDSVGHLKASSRGLPFLRLRHEDLARADSVSAWLWQHSCPEYHRTPPAREDRAG